MLIQHLVLDPLVLAPAVFGMLTIFGRKKKDEKPDEMKEAQTPSVQPPDSTQTASQTSYSSPGVKPTPMAPANASPPGKTGPTPTQFSPSQLFPTSSSISDETSLNRLLQSLLEGLLPSTGGGYEGSDSRVLPSSTPEYVPLRSTPPSRPMMIGPGGKGEKGGEDEDWEEKRGPPGGLVKTPEPQTPQGKIEIRGPMVPQKREEPAEKAPKIEKPEKPEKLEKQVKEPARKEARKPQEFAHIFQLTQGNLETPGFVIVNGVDGSGKTTLCSGLTGSYLKMGNPCIYVTYDQGPSDLRDQMKKLGADPAQYESQFRFMIVDGHTGQSEEFSMEPYYLEKPFDFDNVQDSIVRNSEFFVEEKFRVVFDSLDQLASKVPQKEFVKRLGEILGKVRDAGGTVIATVDLSKLSRDFAGSLEDMADCIIDLSRDDSDPNGRELKVRRLNRSASKLEPETFEIDSSKGLVFV